MRKRSTVCDSFDKLKGLMREKKYSQERLSAELNMSIVTLNRRLNGLASFQWTDMEKLIKILDIKDDEIGEYFFARTLRKRNKLA